MSFDDIERQQQLLQLVKKAIQQDNELRISLQIGDKFRFIRDRLNALLSHLEKNIVLPSSETNQQEKRELKPNEIMVYVYLFNAHGLTLATWQKMLMPELFYEYSVNRPIYLDKAAIESFIRSKSNKAQHAYLSIIVGKDSVLQMTATKDLFGSPVVKVKEGALKFENLVSFIHAGKEYTVSANHELVKKE